MRVAVLTTSYPRDESDIAGTFLRDAVEDLRARGVEIEVVSPASFRHFGVAYGAGIVGNLRRSPAKALLLPAFLVAYTRAARRGAARADLVHAHWLPSGLPARATGKPYVLTMHGTAAELPGYFDRAAVVVCPSRREGYGVVARQAMAHGRPVVATAVGGLAEAVVDGETGLLVPAGDMAALRAALGRLLGDAELRARLGSAGREQVRKP